MVSMSSGASQSCLRPSSSFVLGRIITRILFSKVTRLLAAEICLPLLLLACRGGGEVDNKLLRFAIGLCFMELCMFVLYGALPSQLNTECE